jgi:hypothetical protein
MMTSRTYHALHLDIATFDSSSIIYILMPHRLPAEDISALEELSTRFETNIVTDLNTDMTPWNAPSPNYVYFGDHVR